MRGTFLWDEALQKFIPLLETRRPSYAEQVEVEAKLDGRAAERESRETHPGNYA